MNEPLGLKEAFDCTDRIINQYKHIISMLQCTNEILIKQLQEKNNERKT